MMKFSSVLLLTAFSCLLQEAQDFLDHYRDVLAKNKMIQNKGIYKRWRQLTRTIGMYQITNIRYKIKPDCTDMRLTGLDVRVLPVRHTTSF